MVLIVNNNDDVIGFMTESATYYYDKNLQGDVTGIYNDAGTMVATYRYDAWGNLIATTGDSTLAKKNPIRYRGYYYDEELGLYYLQSRYYDAKVGRFLNADDASMLLLAKSGIKGANLFEYCDNNVVNKADSTGFSWIGSKIKVYIKKIIAALVSLIIFVHHFKSFLDVVRKAINFVAKVFKKVNKASKICKLVTGTKEFISALKVAFCELSLDQKMAILITASVIATGFVMTCIVMGPILKKSLKKVLSKKKKIYDFMMAF